MIVWPKRSWFKFSNEPLFGPVLFYSIGLLPLHSDNVLPQLTLRVRAHLMQSVLQPRHQTSLNAAAVSSLFNEVNAIWAPAGIRFQLEAVDAVQALDIVPKRWFERDRNWVKSAIPTQHFSPTAIDVCFVREMGPNGFFYGEPVVVCEAPEFTKVRGGANDPVARVIAHELGHVLFLQHRQDHTNLMASGRDGVFLNAEEIRDARQRALQILEQAPTP